MRIDNGQHPGRVGPETIARETGLTREQQRYCEIKGFIGRVERAQDATRMYSAEQAAFFRMFATLRQGGLRVEEAAALASEPITGFLKVSDDRLEQLARRAFVDLQENLGVAFALAQLARTRADTRMGQK
jgi:DNA-binding transcriptional MerR regulator